MPDSHHPISATEVKGCDFRILLMMRGVSSAQQQRHQIVLFRLQR
jgi:hypothetical protein